MIKTVNLYFGHLMQRANSVEKTLMLGKIEGGRRGDDIGWDGGMTSPTRWTWVWGISGDRWWTGRPGVLQYMELRRVTHDWATSLSLCCLVQPQPTPVSDMLEHSKSLAHRTACMFKEITNKTNAQHRELYLTLWWPKREGNSKQRGYMCMYSWFSLLYSIN